MLAMRWAFRLSFAPENKKNSAIIAPDIKKKQYLCSKNKIKI
jgi:hypothetical protein